MPQATPRLIDVASSEKWWSMLMMLSRRHTLGLLAGSLLTACAGDGAARKGKLFVGDQRGGSRVVLQGAKRLDDVPYEIIWSQFPNAAPLLEALNAGAIDSGIGGDSAFIFAAGTDAKIKAIGAQATRGMGPVGAGAAGLADPVACGSRRAQGRDPARVDQPQSCARRAGSL